MNTKLKVGVVVVALAVLALIGWNVFSDGYTPQAQTTTKPEGPRVGALSGPDIPSLYLRWGGVQHHPRASNLVIATTTASSWTGDPVCSLRGPVATSTVDLDNTALIFNNAATGTGAKIRVFAGANEHATTTILMARDILAAGGVSVDGIVGTSTHLGADSTSDSVMIIGPNQYINFTLEGLPGPHGAPLSPISGTCHTEFITAQ